jgi:hypothetical protein
MDYWNSVESFDLTYGIPDNPESPWTVLDEMYQEAKMKEAATAANYDTTTTTTTTATTAIHELDDLIFDQMELGHYDTEKKSSDNNIKVKDIKSFTKLCQLSSPTVKKWLDGYPVYRSTQRKLEKALCDCGMTKLQLQNMRRQHKGTLKANTTHHTAFDLCFICRSFSEHDVPPEFPSLLGHTIKIHHHVRVGNEIRYVCETTEQTVAYVTKTAKELTGYNEKQAICDYWERIN